MKNNILLFIIVLFIGSHLISQSLAPSILSVQGGFDQSDKIIIEWTLGENLIETVRPGDKIITQGFHQPSLEIVKVADEKIVLLTEITVTPNPVHAILNIQIRKKENVSYQINLFDSAGHFLRILDVPKNESNIPIDMSYMASGIYLLNISNTAGNLFDTYRIIKY